MIHNKLDYRKLAEACASSKEEAALLKEAVRELEQELELWDDNPNAVQEHKTSNETHTIHAMT